MLYLTLNPRYVVGANTPSPDTKRVILNQALPISASTDATCNYQLKTFGVKSNENDTLLPILKLSHNDYLKALYAKVRKACERMSELKLGVYQTHGRVASVDLFIDVADFVIDADYKHPVDDRTLLSDATLMTEYSELKPHPAIGGGFISKDALSDDEWAGVFHFKTPAHHQDVMNAGIVKLSDQNDKFASQLSKTLHETNYAKLHGEAMRAREQADQQTLEETSAMTNAQINQRL